jgi:hypothetical protein
MYISADQHKKLGTGIEEEDLGRGFSEVGGRSLRTEFPHHSTEHYSLVLRRGTAGARME